MGLGEALVEMPESQSLLTEALQHFAENCALIRQLHWPQAQRLVEEWGHADLGSAWGDWAKVQALQMRRQGISLQEGLPFAHRFIIAATSQDVNWHELLDNLSGLCLMASLWFQSCVWKGCV